MKLTKEQARKAREDLAILNGDPPFNSWSNISYGDGYYAESLKNQYGMSLDELEEVSGYRDAKTKADKIMRKAEKKAAKLFNLEGELE